MVAVAILGSAVVGGVASAVSSSSASHAQQNAANQATKTQLDMYNTTRGDLLPYQQFGKGLLGKLGDAASAQGPSALKEFQPTQSWLESTPGYQFTRQQGLKSVQNSAAARGLGVSGAAMKGGANFATGLANNTWQDQLNSYLTQQNQSWNQKTANQQNQYNRLLGATQLGENAAAQTGAYGTQTGAGVANSQIQAGNAQAAGAIGIGNAIGGVGNNISDLYMLNTILKGGGGAGLFGSS